MNDPRPNSPASITDGDALALIDIHSILEWLATPPAPRAEDELAPLHTHLTVLRNAQTAPHQRHKVLDLLYARAHGVVEKLLPELTGVSLPLSRRTRHTVRGMQDVLLMVAEDYRATLDDLDEHLIKGLRRPPELTLWRILDALYLHLLISNFAASPPGPGIWGMLNDAYRIAERDGHTEADNQGTDCTIRETYQRALLLACAQPASFSSRELVLVVDYVKRFGSRITRLPDGSVEEVDGAFWIDLGRDAPPTADKRRPAPEGALRFACERLAELAEEQIAALEAGVPPEALDLDAAMNTPSGHGILRRLAHYWGQPGKRRFPRRRQNYRAVLCVGLEALWQLFKEDHTQAGEITSWMVTNESPDGYAVMHVSGKTAKLSAGDIVALRTESSNDWQICLVRWALSENPEHLELGLQILATRATPAVLAVPGKDGAPGRHSVLILPPLPPMRTTELLIAPSGTTHAGARKLVLLVERENIEVREMQATHVEEQTSSVELISIALDAEP